MAFPVLIEYKEQKAKIYRPAKGFPFYRISFRVDGKRRMLTYATYGEAKEGAEKKVRELHKGHKSSALTAKEAQDMLDIRDKLATFFRDTGKKVSATEAVDTFLAAYKELPKGSTLLEAVRVFSRTIGSVNPKSITDATHDFKVSRSSNRSSGERARYSAVYARNVETWLTKFDQTFPGHQVSDLTPDLLDTYFKKFSELSEKARNDRRGALGMWLRWCGRKDYIESHQLSKLLACDVMKKEILPDGKIEFYTPEELKKILNASVKDSIDDKRHLTVVTALQAFGGARLEEALRLNYEDLYRNPGHIEISGERAKTRKRRLLIVGDALKAWLEPFKKKTGPIWEAPLNSFITEWARLRESVNVPSKRNGLRHGFVSYSYILRGEIETSAVAGTSPQILHRNYRGLTRKEEAEKWFAVMPT